MYLVSTELREPYAPRKCHVIRQLRNSVRDDLILVALDPPIPRHVYDTTADLSHVILGARFIGHPIDSASKEPVHVYICSPSEHWNQDSNTIPDSDLTLLDWGELRLDQAQP